MSEQTVPDRRLVGWERAVDLPLMVAAVAFLAAYAWPIIDVELAPFWQDVCQWTTWLTWALFVIDYLVRAGLARNRRQYVLRHWIDLVIIALPLLRPLRLLRLIALLNVLNRRVGARLRGRISIYVAGGSILLGFCASLAVLDAERPDPAANIKTFGDAVWWAVATMTTVGYGDRYPVTATGRTVAVALMVGGIALLGIVTATLASWLIEAVQAERDETEDLRASITRLHAKIDRLTSHPRAEQEHDPDRGALP